jgi:hypothetical protein
MTDSFYEIVSKGISDKNTVGLIQELQTKTFYEHTDVLAVRKLLK